MGKPRAPQTSQCPEPQVVVVRRWRLHAGTSPPAIVDVGSRELGSMCRGPGDPR